MDEKIELNVESLTKTNYELAKNYVTSIESLEKEIQNYINELSKKIILKVMNEGKKVNLALLKNEELLIKNNETSISCQQLDFAEKKINKWAYSQTKTHTVIKSFFKVANENYSASKAAMCRACKELDESFDDKSFFGLFAQLCSNSICKLFNVSGDYVTLFSDNAEILIKNKDKFINY